MENNVYDNLRLPTLLFNEDKDPFHELAYLEGTWVGDKGWNIISVPNYDNKPKDADFKLLVEPYTEVLSFEKISGGVPNRGANSTQTNFALKYDMQINKLVDKSTMHVENGMFLYQSDGLKKEENQITRQFVVPHGNSILASGKANVREPQKPIDPKDKEGVRFHRTTEELNTIFSPVPRAKKGETLPLDYDMPYRNWNEEELDILKPINFLLKQMEGQYVSKMVTFNLACDNNKVDQNGGILNTPFIKENADTPSVKSIFWVEKVVIQKEDKKKNQKEKYFMQLQYAQVVDIVFPTKSGISVTWPHISINTLVRIK